MRDGTTCRLTAIACCLFLFGVSNAATEAPAVAQSMLDEVLVTGERPGPGMWRISKDGHDLWVLGTLEPLPKKMTWRSTAVETRIATSQVVLAPPEVDADIGFLRGLTLLPGLLRARKSPQGATLEQTLPHDLYIRWLALRVKFLGRGDDDEQLRPMVAALDLYTHALDESGLISDDSVWKVVAGEAKERHVPILRVVAKLAIDDPKTSIRQLAEIPREAEITCLAKTMERLETDLQPMRQRANSWALGDIAALRATTYADERLACLDAVFSVPRLRAQLQNARATLIGAWLAAAATAITQHANTIAVLPLGEMLGSDGYLQKLRNLGYTIQEP